MNVALLLLSITAAVNWQHPAGMITNETLAEIRQKTETQAWARDTWGVYKRAVQPWVDLPTEELRRIFPTRGGNVYHNFSCPTDRVTLDFDPFNPDRFHCGTCNQFFSPDADSGVYEATDRYHGDLYDGWICLFHITLTQRMVEMALIGRLEGDARLLDRAAELLLLYTERIQAMPWRPGKGLSPDMPMFRQYGSIFTYHREGDNKILFDLAQTYELLRERLTPAQRTDVETHALRRMLDDEMYEPVYLYEHNNIFQWHRTIVQTALALEREDLIDWSFGYGEWSPEKLPEHRSMNSMLATRFNPDGAFWELASGYHLYPVNHLCEYALLSHHMSTMDPVRFPPEQYDLTRRESAGGKVIHNALTWFLSMAMPDRTMTIVGDSTKARSGMENYISTAEIGYRYFDIQAIGDYPQLREGKRSLDGLLYGASEIVQHETPFTSANLSSGWVSLRSEWKGNRLWAGLNALMKGGGHQHADHLSLTHFSQGELLSLEKSVPYNEQMLRELGTQTPAHNTVTVDFQSGPQGEVLAPGQAPVIQYFHAGPLVQFAEVHGDKLYAQAPVYRRAVALVEDVMIDLFRVEGGQTHDWIVNHAGPAPQISLPMMPGTFTPECWLAGGSGKVLAAVTDEQWIAQWTVKGVASRLTMLGAPSSHVFALETYPLDNAVITVAFPPTQTLCVRRTDNAPFLAVWDSWKEQPNLQSIEPATNRSDAVKVVTAGHAYYIVFGPGMAQFADSVQTDSDAALTVVRDHDGLTLVHATRFTVQQGGSASTVSTEQPATVWMQWKGGAPEMGLEGDISYDTVGGEDHPRPAPALVPATDGNWFHCAD